MADARVEVRAAQFSDKEILRQLLEFQGYEHSRFDGADLDSHGVLTTGVYGSGKSSVGAEIAFMLERRGEPYAPLDLDYLGWGGVPGSGRVSEVALMTANLAAVAANYRQAEVRRFVLACFLRNPGELDTVRDALGVPVRVVRLTVSLDEISQRLAGNVTSGRLDDLRAAAESLATGQGAGPEDLAVANDWPVAAVAQQIMDFLGWTDP